MMSDAAIELCKWCPSPEACRANNMATCPNVIVKPKVVPPAPIPKAPVDAPTVPTSLELDYKLATSWAPAVSDLASKPRAVKGSDRLDELVERAKIQRNGIDLRHLRPLFEEAIVLNIRASVMYFNDFMSTLARSTGHDVKKLQKAFGEAARDHKSSNSNGGGDDDGNEPPNNGGSFDSIEQQYAWFNSQFYAIREYGNTSVIKRFNEEMTDGEKIDLALTYDKFTTAWGDKVVWDEEGKRVSVAARWLIDPATKDNRFVRELFEPQPPGTEFNRVMTRTDGERDINRWKGYRPAILQVNPLDGGDFKSACPMLGEYFTTVLANGDREVFKYILRWETDAVTNPRRLAGRTALYFWDPLGRTGKNMFFHLNAAIFGYEQCFLSARAKVMDGSFTEQFANKYFTCADEAPVAAKAGPRADLAEQRKAFLWSIIDDRTMDLEPKGIGMRQVTNYSRRMLASNKMFGVSGTGGADRIFATEVSACRRNDFEFYRALQAIYDDVRTGGELDKFFSLMVEAKDTAWMRDFHPQVHKPITATMDAQRDRDLDGFPSMLRDLLNRGELLFVNTGEHMAASALHPELNTHGNVASHFVASKTLRGFLNNLPGHTVENVSDSTFGRNIMNVFAWHSDDTAENKRLKRYGRGNGEGRRWPPLWVCRRLWELKYFEGRSYDWSIGDADDETEEQVKRPDWRAPVPRNNVG
ncbi:MAG: hypothetical protein E5Y02_10350 [Mesorhizobium sp.]|nr:MAG: hypothetical protein E5Y02_10350 [Mesorhizobium sp.]